MGEIKSTLDIIMEKTKGLSMTEEEKKELKKTEIEGKVRGLLNKFLEGILDLERLKREWSNLGEDRQEIAREVLKKECLNRIDPGADNNPLLEALAFAPPIYAITIFTSFFLTTITFLIVFPSVCLLTFSAFMASSLTDSSSESAGTVISALTLPLT